MEDGIGSEDSHKFSGGTCGSFGMAYHQKDSTLLQKEETGTRQG